MAAASQLTSPPAAFDRGVVLRVEDVTSHAVIFFASFDRIRAKRLCQVGGQSCLSEAFEVALSSVPVRCRCASTLVRHRPEGPRRATLANQRSRNTRKHEMRNQSWRHALLTKTDKSVQVFEVDLNYGLGDRIQLTYEVPLVWQSAMCNRTAECDGTGQWPARYQVAVHRWWRKWLQCFDISATRNPWSGEFCQSRAGRWCAVSAAIRDQ
jgi:hypothetical protein